VAGILCARFLGAQVVVTSLNASTAAEKCGAFSEVRRTRIGSPYVIEEMSAAIAEGLSPVVGYESNGGFLLGSEVSVGQGKLWPLMSRDSFIVILSVLCLAARSGRSIRNLVDDLPQRYTASDRIKEFPTERGKAAIQELTAGNQGEQLLRVNSLFGGEFGAACELDKLDGVRVIFDSSIIVHLRASGNAPEFRCYAEARSDQEARRAVEKGLEVARRLAG